jgi:type VII secretion protein EccB
MVSRRDQYLAHRFVLRRSATALLHDDADSARNPIRRMVSTTVLSVTVGAVTLVAAGVWGLVKPQSPTGWKDGRTLIVEQGTGSRFLDVGGVLHPVVNFASAQLLLHTATPPTASVRAAALASIPRGAALGIPGAPEEVPSPAAAGHAAWSVCSSPAVDPAGAARPQVQVVIGGAAHGSGSPLAAGSALLVRGRTAGAFLIWGGQRLQIAGDYVLTGLNYATTPPLAVGDAWLEAVPEGPPLASLQVPGIGGAPATAVSVAGAAREVGDVLQVGGAGGGAASYYLVMADGLAPITDVQERLLAADPAVATALRHAEVPVTVTAADVAALPRAAEHPADVPGLPASPPLLTDPAGGNLQVCATLAADQAATAAMAVTTTPQTALVLSADPAPRTDPDGHPLADTVSVAPGGGALVRELPNPAAATGTLYLVDDLGRRYPLADTAAVSDLGLGTVTATPVPPGLLRLVPAGPTLSEAAAGNPASSP